VSAGSHLTQSHLGWGLPSGILIHAAIWPQQIWAENWGDCAPLGRQAGSPSNTMWLGPRPTCVPSFILIRPTVWPQCTNVTDRRDRQTEQSNSIRQTVLQSPNDTTDTKLLLLIFALDQLAFHIFRHLSVAFDVYHYRSICDRAYLLSYCHSPHAVSVTL